MWIVHTEGAMRSCLSVAAVTSVLAALVSLLGLGDHILTYQFAVIIIAGTAYFGLSVPALFADNERLRQLLMVDSLTGATSRPFFIEAARRELERARRDRTPLSLIIFDLDEFKAINDRHGHQAGDAVLRQLGQILNSSIRSIDIVARYGGDEFCTVMPEADGTICAQFMERLRGSISEARIRSEGMPHDLSCTISLGGAVFPDHGQDPDSLIYAADMALLKAKEGGRDRFVLFESNSAVEG